eukprot:1838619-Alexandrium_andersonii.AAC.1
MHFGSPRARERHGSRPPAAFARGVPKNTHSLRIIAPWRNPLKSSSSAGPQALPSPACALDAAASPCTPS